MASSVTNQTSIANGLTEIMAQMVNAGWTHESTANPLTLSSTNYYVMTSSSNSINQTYYVLIYNPNGTNYIQVELFETYNSGNQKKSFWAPSGTDTPNTSGQVNVAEQLLSYTTNVAAGELNCGSSTFTLLVKATADYILLACQQGSTRSNLYAGSYITYPWNTETMPLILASGLYRGFMGPWSSSSIGTYPQNAGTQSLTSGAAMTRERFPGVFVNFSNSAVNFVGAWYPLKPGFWWTAASPGVAGTRDAFNPIGTIGMDVVLYKASGGTSGTSYREGLFGKYRDVLDFGGIGGGTIGDTIVVNGVTYYLFGNQTGIPGDVYVPA